MVKLTVVAGTRPEYVQVDPIIKAARSNDVDVLFIETEWRDPVKMGWDGWSSADPEKIIAHLLQVE